MHIKKSLAAVILACCFFADGSIPGTQAYAGENQIAYCASAEDLDAIFNDAQLMESDTVQFQCSEAFLNALLEDGSILTKAEYGHNMVNASIQYDQSGWMELSDIEYGEIFCSQCSTQDDIANTFSSYVEGQDPEEVIALFLDEPLFREMMDGSRLEVLAFQAGINNFDLKYSEQSNLFWMENITYEERAGEEAVLVSNEEEFHSLMDYYAAEGKTVDVLINNAGIIDIKHFKDIPEERVSSMIMIHNHALAVLTRLFLPGMLERGGGYILNISSISAWMPYPYISEYSATKAYVKVFTKALRTECRRSGVKVATIYFGAVSTSLYDLQDKYRNIALRSGIMITSDKAARRALRMLFAGRSGRVPGFVNRIAIFLAPLMPSWLIAAIDRKATSAIEKRGA